MDKSKSFYAYARTNKKTKRRNDVLVNTFFDLNFLFGNTYYSKYFGLKLCLSYLVRCDHCQQDGQG